MNMQGLIMTKHGMRNSLEEFHVKDSGGQPLIMNIKEESENRCLACRALIAKALYFVIKYQNTGIIGCIIV